MIYGILVAKTETCEEKSVFEKSVYFYFTFSLNQMFENTFSVVSILSATQIAQQTQFK